MNTVKVIQKQLEEKSTEILVLTSILQSVDRIFETKIKK